MSSTNSNDKLMGLLAWLLSPIMPAIVLFTDMKNNPELKGHAVQALALWVVELVVSILLTVTVILACLAPFVFIPQLVYGIFAYQGKPINIPVVTDFCKKQGWM